MSKKGIREVSELNRLAFAAGAVLLALFLLGCVQQQAQPSPSPAATAAIQASPSPLPSPLPSPSLEPSPLASPSLMPSPVAPASPSPSYGPTIEAKEARVRIQDYKYWPQLVNVRVGARVTWTNQDALNYTVTGEGFDSGVLMQYGSWSYVFDEPGDFVYRSKINPGMQGMVVVVE